MKLIFFSIAIFVLCFLPTKNTYGWGHHKLLNTIYQRSYLIFDVIDKGVINFCVQINDLKFSHKSISIQTEIALKAWLEPLFFSTDNIRIENVTCSANNFDIQVIIGPESQFPKLRAYQLPSKRNDHYFTQIKIDSNYNWTDTLLLVNLHDQSLEDSKHFLEDLSFNSPMSVLDLSINYKVDVKGIKESGAG